MNLRSIATHYIICVMLQDIGSFVTTPCSVVTPVTTQNPLPQAFRPEAQARREWQRYIFSSAIRGFQFCPVIANPSPHVMANPSPRVIASDAKQSQNFLRQPEHRFLHRCTRNDTLTQPSPIKGEGFCLHLQLHIPMVFIVSPSASPGLLAMTPGKSM